MYIKELKIENSKKILRNLEFHSGLNLIIDETPATDVKTTGNNVGKTTVLKLIDFCLGAKASAIYTDEENKKEVYKLVKEYLTNEKILITLVLADRVTESESNEIIIERNFLSGKKNCIRKINGKQVLEKDFEDELAKLIFPDHDNDKPTFRQIISHNIRYKDDSINNTLKTLNRYTSDVEYESLYLFLLGCTFDDGAKKQNLVTKIKQEETFKIRLEKVQTKNAYEVALSLIEDKIEILNNRKKILNLNENFEQDLEELNLVKYKINKSSSTISKLHIRKSIIDEAQNEMEQSVSDIDIKQLEQLYSEAKNNIVGIQKTFEQLVSYHNSMLLEKIRFITAEIPTLIKRIAFEQSNIDELLIKERELSEKIAKSDSFVDLENIISELNEKYRLKGEYESIVTQIEYVDYNMKKLNDKIKIIDNHLFSDDFESILKKKIKSFNKFFSQVSLDLYGEQYALKYDKVVNKKKQQFYKFSAFNANMSSGKKQGEIVCFDLAYILFANHEKIPCLNFLLNDKKELMHDNQLNKIAEFVQENNIQLVISILKDKMPLGMEDKGHIVVRLSQEHKLFKIEEQTR
jgi:uncharacterized protein YydD (DUF2326 family)